MSSTTQKRTGLRRVAHMAWVIARVLLTIIAVATVAIVLCIDLPAVRRLAVSKVNQVLESTFAGKIVIENINHLGFTGLRGARIQIVDPEGVQVILVDGVRVHISTFAAAKSFLLGKGDLEIEISEVSVDYVDVNLDVDTSGALRLGRAFTPKGAPSTPSSRGTDIHIPRIAVQHVWAHGLTQGSLWVDAEVDEFSGSMSSTPKRLAFDVDKLRVQTRSAPGHADPHLGIEAHYAKPASSGEDQSILAKIKGDIGGIPTTIDASMMGQEIKAVVDVPPFSADKVQAMSPGAPVHQDASLHIEAHGHLPDLEGVAHATLGAGRVDVHVRASLDKTTTVHAVVDASQIDARAFSPTSPPSALGANLVVDVKGTDTTTTGHYAFDIPGGSFAHQVVPHAHLEGDLAAPGKSSPAGQMTTLSGSGHIDEQGAPVDLSFKARSVGSATAISFDVAGRAAALAQTRLGNAANGSIALHAVGAVELGPTSSMEAQVDVSGSNLVQGKNRIGRVVMGAHASGPLDAATVDARVSASSIAVSNSQFATAVITAKGNAKAIDVTARANPTSGPNLDASARVELGDFTVVRGVRLAASRNDVRAVLGVKTVKIGKDQIDVDGLELEGVGDTLRADVHKSASALNVRASTNELDLPRLSRLFRNQDLDGGHAAFDIDLAMARSKAKGHVRLDFNQVTVERVRNANAHVDVSIDGRQLEAAVHTTLGQAGDFDIETKKLELGEGNLLHPSTWKSAVGTVDVSANFDIAKIRGLFPRGSMPFDEMEGRIKASGELRRESVTQNPAVTLSVQTAGLVLSAKTAHEQVDDVRVFETPPWRLEGVDFAVKLGIQSKQGATQVSAHAFDKQGDLATFTLQGDSAPYAEWLGGKPPTMATLSALPLRVSLIVPARDLKTLPAVFKTRGWSGTVDGRLDVEGPIQAPSVHLAGGARKLFSNSLQGVKPLDGTIDARYDRGQSKLTINVDSNGARLLDGFVNAQGEFPKLIAHPEQPLAWQASSKIHLAAFPLGSVTTLADFKMKGNVSGDFEITDLHKDARLKVDLAFDRLRVGKVDYPKAHAQVGFDGKLLKALLHLEQTDGSLDTTAELGMGWDADVVPHVDSDQSAVLAMQAKRFRAEALLPFASGALSALSGRIDGSARVELAGTNAKMQGLLTFNDGKVQLNTVGEPFSGVQAKVTLTPDGMVRLDDVVAHGSQGTVNMHGYAHLNGFALTEAKASIHIPKNDALPVDADGQEIGYIDGDIELSAVASADKKELDLKIDIPRLHTLLPNDSHSVQDLKEAKEIHVGYHRRPTIFIKVPEVAEDLKPENDVEVEPTVTKVAINLGKDVEVRKGTSLRIALDGNPVLVISDKARMTGQLRLTRGFLDVQGHHFDIEKGTVTFVGDEPGNPQILVTAVWKAPEGSLVYADFTGPLKTGKVRLRSEPAHSQNEIISLIMFGSTDGQTSSSYQSQDQGGAGTAGKAGAAAGGFASEGLSKGLNDLTGLDVAAKVDTSTANPRPEVVLQITRTISLQLGYVVGTLPLTNPDRTLVTVGWRFFKNWQMEGTYGNAGTTLLDLIWQYRY
jgi:translocation and assembly module TamB